MKRLILPLLFALTACGTTATATPTTEPPDPRIAKTCALVRLWLSHANEVRKHAVAEGVDANDLWDECGAEALAHTLIERCLPSPTFYTIDEFNACAAEADRRIGTGSPPVSP